MRKPRHRALPPPPLGRATALGRAWARRRRPPRSRAWRVRCAWAAPPPADAPAPSPGLVVAGAASSPGRRGAARFRTARSGACGEAASLPPWPKPRGQRNGLTRCGGGAGPRAPPTHDRLPSHLTNPTQSPLPNLLDPAAAARPEQGLPCRRPATALLPPPAAGAAPGHMGGLRRGRGVPACPGSLRAARRRPRPVSPRWLADRMLRPGTADPARHRAAAPPLRRCPARPGPAAAAAPPRPAGWRRRPAARCRRRSWPRCSGGAVKEWGVGGGG